ncbi:MAG: hypothetical protein GX902_05880 [Lentisphaerae bacterium]|nr:hypothetical protein [Lentisphaerota bacterium]
MWICTRCQTSNEEGYARCIQCGASRSARRFGAGTPIPAPSVSEAPPAGAAPQVRQVEAPPARAPRAQHADAPAAHSLPYEKRVVRCAIGRWLVALGLILAFVMPLLALLLAVTRQEAVKPTVMSVYFPQDAAIPPVLDSVAYWLTALLAALLVALPGLSAAGMGRLLIRLTPPERKRRAG